MHYVNPTAPTTKLLLGIEHQLSINTVPYEHQDLVSSTYYLPNHATPVGNIPAKFKAPLLLL